MYVCNVIRHGTPGIFFISYVGPKHTAYFSPHLEHKITAKPLELSYLMCGNPKSKVLQVTRDGWVPRGRLRCGQRSRIKVQVIFPWEGVS